MKYLQKQLIEKQGKIVWMTSYPKSGNTWFRCFISALFTGEIDLAKLKSDGIFSARQIFDVITGIDSRLLTDDEAYHTIADVYREHAKNSNQLLFVKVHDAYLYNSSKEPIFPSDVSHKVIYLVRNPLDVVGSFAHHNASTIDKTIDLMNKPKAYIAGNKDGLNNNIQFRQLMYDWSNHVKSWVEQKNIDVILVRYEDMLYDTYNTFSRIVEELEISASKTAINKAIKKSSFKQLQSQEKKKGFKEKNIKADNFFRSGKTNQYLNELTPEQIDKIYSFHKKQMNALGYFHP